MPIISSGSSSGRISGVAISGTAAASQVPVASSSSAGAWAYPPGFEVGYDQITAAVNITGTTQAAANAIITCAAHTFDGAAVLLDFYCPFLAHSTTAGATLGVSLFESGSVICDLAFLRNASTTGQFYSSLRASLRFTPTAASHSYVIAAYTSSTTGTPAVSCGTGTAGAVVPCYVRFTKV